MFAKKPTSTFILMTGYKDIALSYLEYCYQTPKAYHTEELLLSRPLTNKQPTKTDYPFLLMVEQSAKFHYHDHEKQTHSDSKTHPFPNGLTVLYESAARYLEKADIIKLGHEVKAVGYDAANSNEITKDQARFIIAASAAKDNYDLSHIKGFETIGKAMQESALLKEALQSYNIRGFGETTLFNIITHDGKVDANEAIVLQQYVNAKKHEKAPGKGK